VREADYFDALQNLLDTRLRKVPDAERACYQLREPDQSAFYFDPRNLSRHFAIQLENLPGQTWPFFKMPHAHAHKRCDCIVVTWSRLHSQPVYMLLELKSANSRGAALQLRASLAFCHFVHHMLCVNVSTVPDALFAGITVKKPAFALKLPSLPVLPDWQPQALQKDCAYMIYNRSTGVLPLAAILKQLENHRV